MLVVVVVVVVVVLREKKVKKQALFIRCRVRRVKEVKIEEMKNLIRVTVSEKGALAIRSKNDYITINVFGRYPPLFTQTLFHFCCAGNTVTTFSFFLSIVV